jgi:hypothetical protein
MCHKSPSETAAVANGHSQMPEGKLPAGLNLLFLASDHMSRLSDSYCVRALALPLVASYLKSYGESWWIYVSIPTLDTKEPWKYTSASGGRFFRGQMTVHNSHTYCVSETYPLTGILRTREHCVVETGSVRLRSSLSEGPNRVTVWPLASGLTQVRFWNVVFSSFLGYRWIMDELQNPSNCGFRLCHCNQWRKCVRYEVFMAVTMNDVVFWDVTLCGSCKNWRFRETWRLLHQGDKNR